MEQYKEDYKVITSWDLPYTGCPPDKIRPKRFQLIECNNGNKAFLKQDSNLLVLKHEAKILNMLRDVNCVPSLITIDDNILITEFIEGRLLVDVLPSLGAWVRLRISLQFIGGIYRIHKKKVIHGDLALWNLILGDGNKLCFIDFEYARHVDEHVADLPSELASHLRGNAFTPIMEWIRCLAIIDNLLANHLALRPFLWLNQIASAILIRIKWRSKGAD